MPDVTYNSTTEVSLDINIQVYCGICGAGICNKSDASIDKRNNISVTAYCLDCDTKIKNLERDIEKLELEIEYQKELVGEANHA